MERLTEKRDGKNVIPLRQDGKIRWSISEAGFGFEQERYLCGEYADRLAEYEDTELAPEQINEIDKAYSEQAKELGELKKQLPQCKVGNIVYDIEFGSIEQYRITGFSFGTADGYIDEPVTESETIYYYSGYGVTGSFAQSAIGSSIFLTREEAEEKLKEMEEFR